MPRNGLSAMQGKYWFATVPYHHFVPHLPVGIVFIRGQLERGEGGFLHWQLLLHSGKNARGPKIASLFQESHVELSRSAAASEYVWKEETRVPNTQFELGKLPFKRNCATDWDAIRQAAVEGLLESVPSDVYVRCYNQLRRIGSDHLRPVAMERACTVLWGRTGTGKSRAAWEAAGMEAYPKNPRSKFWDGYKNHRHVVMDEFRGGIDIAYLLIWLDRYPVIVEVKGSSVVLRATHIWITSNMDPRNWYPEVDQETRDALLRRLNIHHYH